MSIMDRMSVPVAMEILLEGVRGDLNDRLLLLLLLRLGGLREEGRRALLRYCGGDAVVKSVRWVIATAVFAMRIAQIDAWLSEIVFFFQAEPGSPHIALLASLFGMPTVADAN